MAKTIGFENDTEVSTLKSLSANIFYCHNCNIPIIQKCGKNGDFCSLCNSKKLFCLSLIRFN